MRKTDLHGTFTAAERNPSLASPPRRNYGSRRRQLLPLDERIKRLRNHFAGVEHFAGAEYPPPTFDLDNPFEFRQAVNICVFQEKLTDAQTAELLGTTESAVEFAISVLRQHAE